MAEEGRHRPGRGGRWERAGGVPLPWTTLGVEHAPATLSQRCGSGCTGPPSGKPYLGPVSAAVPCPPRLADSAYRPARPPRPGSNFAPGTAPPPEPAEHPRTHHLPPRSVTSSSRRRRTPRPRRPGVMQLKAHHDPAQEQQKHDASHKGGRAVEEGDGDGLGACRSSCPEVSGPRADKLAETKRVEREVKESLKVAREAQKEKKHEACAG